MVMELQKYHSKDKIMERVQVWIHKIRFTREKKQEAGKKYEVRCMEFPSESTFLGECEATPGAVAKLAKVHEYYAWLALERMGTAWWVFSEELGPESIEYYLLCLPAGYKPRFLI